MELQLPNPIASYVRAENSGDVNAMSECFAPYATVRDEGFYYEGLPSIKKWKAHTARKHGHTMKPLAIDVAKGAATLRAEVGGSLPGSSVIADFRFVLVGDLIASLRIS